LIITSKVNIVNTGLKDRGYTERHLTKSNTHSQSSKNFPADQEKRLLSLGEGMLESSELTLDLVRKDAWYKVRWSLSSS
jgi:hypothetical protein